MVSIKKIQKLRTITSLGIMECKEALIKANGDVDLAVENLYSKGTIKYIKKSSTKLGFVNVGLNQDKTSAIIVEFNTQTDFVSKNEQFLKFVKEVTQVALNKNIKKIDELLQESIEDKTIEKHQSILVNQFKENIHISRLKQIHSEKGVLGAYVHNNKIASVVNLDKKELKTLAHEIAIHITAMKPEYIKVDDVEKERIEKEKNILIEQVKKEHPNKNQSILEKITEGKLNKLFQEIVLYKQTFVKDKNKNIENLLKENLCNITDMCRFEVEKS
jgi:elongation factor Ts